MRGARLCHAGCSKATWLTRARSLTGILRLGAALAKPPTAIDRL